MRVNWPLHQARPIVEVTFISVRDQSRRLIADTGAGSSRDTFHVILTEDDCLYCGGFPVDVVRLRGAYAGRFPVYSLRVRIDALGYTGSVYAAAVRDVHPGFDGFACFRFLRRFHFGNFGDPDGFGLETLAAHS